MAMWIEFRVTQDRRHAIFETLGNEVLQTLGFLVNLIPGILQHIVEEQFEEAMMPHQLPGPPFACSSQPDTAMFFIQDQRRPLRRQFL